MATKLPDFMEQFARLVAAPTVSSNDPSRDMSNRPMVDDMAGWLEDAGLKVEIMPVAANPEKVNLIAVAGRGEGGFVLSGHTDTVPYDSSGWKHDPFRLTEADGRLYGLGTSDMKCFFPIALEVIAEFDPARLKSPVYLLATCDEESTMIGAKSLVTGDRRLGRYALIGEPTGLQPVNLHKGILFETVRLIGRSGHSSDPALGINALEGMNAVVNALTAWRDRLQDTERHPGFRIPYPTLNFGSIHGGDSPNRICGECELKIDVRFLPDMHIDEIRAGIRRTVLEAIDGAGLAAEFDCIFPGLPGLDTAADSELVRLAERLSGRQAGSVAFGTEGPYLASLGMETIILGPGDIDVAHQPNEYLPMERIEPMKGIIRGMIKHFCCDFSHDREQP